MFRNSVFVCCALTFPVWLSLSACGPNNRKDISATPLRTFTLTTVQPDSSKPDWSAIKVDMQVSDRSRPLFSLLRQKTDLSRSLQAGVELSVRQGTYLIDVAYLDANQVKIYESCPSAKAFVHPIVRDNYQATIDICPVGESTPIGSSQLTELTEVQIVPEAQKEKPAITPQGASSGACLRPDYGLPTGPIPSKGQGIPYPNQEIKLQLPSLRLDASNKELKEFVAKLYDSIPTFPRVYEQELGLTRQQALAFMFADMSRESAQGERWRIDLETGVGGPGHAWGPFQAAVTNFTGGPYEQDLKIYHHTGLPILSMNLFKDPAASTYTGMKRLADGILRSIKDKDIGLGRSAKDYLLGTLADHNTGWPSTALDATWQKDYGLEVLRLMQAYQYGDNMTNDRAFWTTQPTAEICR